MGEIFESMKLAIDFERRGYDVYVNAAEKTKNKLGKETLMAIAAKELDHIKAIEQFTKNLEIKEDINKATGIINPMEKKKYVKDIFIKIKNQLDEKALPDSDLEKAYEVGMQLEQESYDFYKKHAAEAKDPQIREFFGFLMKEENNHYELLQDTLKYLNNPGQWFKEQERWIVEG